MCLGRRDSEPGFSNSIHFSAVRKLLGGPGCCGLPASPRTWTGSHSRERGQWERGHFPARRPRELPPPGLQEAGGDGSARRHLQAPASLGRAPGLTICNRGAGGRGVAPELAPLVRDATVGWRPLTTVTTGSPGTAPGSWGACAAHSPALMLVPRAHRRPRRCGPWPGPGRRDAPRRGCEAEGRSAAGGLGASSCRLLGRCRSRVLKPRPTHCGRTSFVAPQGLLGLVVRAASNAGAEIETPQPSDTHSQRGDSQGIR